VGATLLTGKQMDTANSWRVEILLPPTMGYGRQTHQLGESSSPTVGVWPSGRA